MHPESVQLDVADFLHFRVGEHRMVQPQLAAVLCRFVEDIARAAQQRGQDMTDRSRIESMGGLLTWANFCRK